MTRDKRKKDAPPLTETPSIAESAKKNDKAKSRESQEKGRTRNFATVVYPESAPADWVERLDSYHVQSLISPLHDKDTNPSGEPKKAHYHVLLMFEGPKDFDNQVKPIFDEIGGVGRENVNSARGYSRYLCHMDNPEKYQYEPSEVRQLGGANFMLVTQLPTDDIKILGDIFQYIRENEIYSLAELLDLSKIYHPEWFTTVAMSRAYVVDKYIKSLTWERESGYVRASDRNPKCDKETGEVL